MSSTREHKRHMELVYDRATRSLRAPDAFAHGHARLLQIIHRVLAPLGYLGISRLFGVVNAVFPTGDREMVIEEGPFRFRFPAGDYYWTRLLDPDWRYEPEIDGLLTAIRDRPWLFVDLGANYGYWSARAAAGFYGPRRVVAVEPAMSCYVRLRDNLEPFGDRARTYRYAVAERCRGDVQLYGTRHAGFSIDPGWEGASSAVADTVPTTTLDAVLLGAGVDLAGPDATPLVVKLDVEGVERQALEGSQATVAGRSLFLVEDAVGPGRVCEAVRYARAELGMRLYAMPGSAVRRLDGLEDVVALKRRASRIQQAGLNLFATASPWWWAVLEDLVDGGAEGERR
jgi:FkbM family methyltransferase